VNLAEGTFPNFSAEKNPPQANVSAGTLDRRNIFAGKNWPLKHFPQDSFAPFLGGRYARCVFLERPLGGRCVHVVCFWNVLIFLAVVHAFSIKNRACVLVVCLHNTLLLPKLPLFCVFHKFDRQNKVALTCVWLVQPFSGLRTTVRSLSLRRSRVPLR
jgi:hypothetical protein